MEPESKSTEKSSTPIEEDDPCILWDKALNIKGYGIVKHGRNMRLAHTVVYEKAFGASPKGYDVHHECNNRACVNLRHLKLVTHKENIRYSKGWTKDSLGVWICFYGHRLEGANILNRSSSIKCRACHNIRRRVNAT